MKKKPVKAKELHIGCLNCSTACLKLPLNREIAVGFGSAFVKKNNKIIYDGEMAYRDGKRIKRVRYFEKLARKSPQVDWQIILHGPMHGETFQRQGKNNWVCVESNRGFA